MTNNGGRQGWRVMASAAALGMASLAAQAVTVSVDGNSNPNLAGRAVGYACCSGDSVPNEAPVLVSGLTLTAGQALTFMVSGQVSYYGGGTSGDNPDGTVYNGFPSNYGDGITAPSDVNRIDALVGVFLTDTDPTGTTSPAALSLAGGLDFPSLSPLIGQIFFIGNGLTGDTATGDHGGQAQQFWVPTGATRLYLGTSDGYGWYNNTGAFTVEVTAVPEPSSIALVLAGLAVSMGVGLRRRVRH
jgi:hypothetical protein